MDFLHETGQPVLFSGQFFPSYVGDTRCLQFEKIGNYEGELNVQFTCSKDFVAIDDDEPLTYATKIAMV